MRIQIVGSARDMSGDEISDSSKKILYVAAKQLGKKLAEEGHTIIVQSDRYRTVDYHTVTGALEAKPPGKVEVHTRSQKKKRYSNLKRSQSVLIIPHDNNDPLSVQIETMEKEVDIVLVLCGGDRTYELGKAAFKYGKPVLPIGGFGGAGERLWNEAWKNRKSCFGNHLTDDEIKQLKAPWDKNHSAAFVGLMVTKLKNVQIQMGYDVFLSYATGDGSLAAELKESLEKKGLRCFMAEKDIPVATIWENQIHAALLGSKRILLLLTPRSVNRPWVLLEVGAAWALKKDLIPALIQVSPSDLVDPVRKYQARVIETSAQKKNLVQELLSA